MMTMSDTLREFLRRMGSSVQSVTLSPVAIARLKAEQGDFALHPASLAKATAMTFMGVEIVEGRHQDAPR